MCVRDRLVCYTFWTKAHEVTDVKLYDFGGSELLRVQARVYELTAPVTTDDDERLCVIGCASVYDEL
jgi:hypothetical protein